MRFPIFYEFSEIIIINHHHRSSCAGSLIFNGGVQLFCAVDFMLIVLNSRVWSLVTLNLEVSDLYSWGPLDSTPLSWERSAWNEPRQKMAPLLWKSKSHHVSSICRICSSPHAGFAGGRNRNAQKTKKLKRAWDTGFGGSTPGFVRSTQGFGG